MGTLMFVLNLFTVKTIGTIICCGITMFNYFISNFLSSRWVRYSPISFSNLTLIDGDDISEEEGGHSRIQCISDYEKRTYLGNNIRNKYLNNEYRGIPIVKEIKFGDLIQRLKKEL